MFIADILHHTAHLTFGRNTAQFKQLVAMLALVSVILWSIVLLTTVARILLCHVWYRRQYASSRTNMPPI